MDEALKLLAKANYRVTRQRKALLAKILRQTKPFSFPSLTKSLSGKNGCDPATIWRSLPVFLELGIIEKCDFSEDGVSQYEVKLGTRDGHHHHHIICVSCKKVEPLKFCLVENQQKALNRKGYKNLNHRLEFSGVCPACS